MATMTATARQGETLDLLVWRVLGAGAGVVEQAYELNRDLAEIGAVLPEGRSVLLPVVEPQAAGEAQIIKLWD